MLLVVMPTTTTTALRWPFSNKQQSKSYTPLVFFTIPPGNLPQVDAMEKAVRQIEKELHVKVERLDLARNPANEAVLATVTNRYRVPVLYHRESREFYAFPATKDASVVPPLDMNALRAWAKGRFISRTPFATQAASAMGTQVQKPTVLTSEDKGVDQDDLLEDLTLTPQQREGKKAMQERTEKLAQ